MLNAAQRRNTELCLQGAFTSATRAIGTRAFSTLPAQPSSFNLYPCLAPAWPPAPTHCSFPCLSRSPAAGCGCVPRGPLLLPHQLRGPVRGGAAAIVARGRLRRHRRPHAHSYHQLLSANRCPWRHRGCGCSYRVPSPAPASGAVRTVQGATPGTRQPPPGGGWGQGGGLAAGGWRCWGTGWGGCGLAAGAAAAGGCGAGGGGGAG